MNIKQKIIRGKDQQPKSRYSVQLKNCNSASSILKAKEIALQNKQNDLIQFNKKTHELQQKIQPQKSCQLEVLTSMQLSKQLKTSINIQEKSDFMLKSKKQQGQDLQSSQEMFIFRQKNQQKMDKSSNFDQQLTFGSVNRKREEGFMVTSRQFIQQNKVKNDVIDQMFVNARRCLAKSIIEPGVQEGLRCVNHQNKNAKYRLISELEEGQQQMFYCSKCAINLLQRGFKIEEVKHESNQNYIRMQQIHKFQVKLKKLQEKTQIQINKKQIKQPLNLKKQQINEINQKFTIFIQMVRELWNSIVSESREKLKKKESQYKFYRQGLSQVARSIQDLQSQIREYKNNNKFMIMKENQFNFIYSSLDNKINRFDATLKAASTFSLKDQSEISQNIDYNLILQKIKSRLEDKQEHIYINNEGDLSFEKKRDPFRKLHKEDFVCELKQPFRTLFPCEENDQNQIQTQRQPYSLKKSLLSSVRECPTFKKHT